jgi:hypothetical protein
MPEAPNKNANVKRWGIYKSLGDVAAKGQQWATPRTTDSHGAGEHGEGGQDLRTESALWATATSRDHKDGANPSEAVPTNGLLGRQAPRSGIAGPPSSPDGLTLPRLRLSPRFVEWLMGFPLGWTDSEPLVMPSCPK